MRAAILCAALAVFLTGCTGTKQPEFADLHPVSGSVTQGGKAVSGGAVEFTPDPPNREFTINSEVKADGTFKLFTVRMTDSKGERKPGAPTGKYNVTYAPPVADQTAGNGPVTLGKTVSVEAKENDFKLDFPTK